LGIGCRPKAGKPKNRISWPKSLDIFADRFYFSGQLDSQNCVSISWFSKAKDHSAPARFPFSHQTVGGRDSCGMDFDQHFVCFRDRFRNLFELKDIGWTIVVIDDRFLEGLGISKRVEGSAMSSRHKSAKASATKTSDAAGAWSKLTWDDLDSWAGARSVQRGKSYQRSGQVRDLALAADGRLLAAVQGGKRYVTVVQLSPGKGSGRKLTSACSCPVAIACKHAVAVVAEYLTSVAEGRAVPAADPDDPRWAKLAGRHADESDEFDDDEEVFEEEFGSRYRSSEDDFEMEDDDDARRPVRFATKSSGRKSGGKAKRFSRAKWDQKIHAHIEQKSQEELAALVRSLIARFPELRQEFQERILLGEGDHAQLVTAARRDLRAVTAEHGWRNHWNGEGNTPDYSRLKHKLERLVELGHCDGVVELGRELIARGFDQIGQSDDEGETGMELAECLDVVFDAVKKSSLSPVDKILYAIDAYLEDDWGILDDAKTALEEKWSKGDWSLVADRLADRVGKPSCGERVRDSDADDFTLKYRRDGLTGFLADALERAGRGDELLPLHEAEARATGSYQRLTKMNMV
jgi:uncharacterized Zn finger protein